MSKNRQGRTADQFPPSLIGITVRAWARLVATSVTCRMTEEISSLSRSRGAVNCNCFPFSWKTGRVELAICRPISSSMFPTMGNRLGRVLWSISKYTRNLYMCFLLPLFPARAGRRRVKDLRSPRLSSISKMRFCWPLSVSHTVKISSSIAYASSITGETVGMSHELELTLSCFASGYEPMQHPQSGDQVTQFTPHSSRVHPSPRRKEQHMQHRNVWMKWELSLISNSNWFLALMVGPMCKYRLWVWGRTVMPSGWWQS